jgi:hypothetical protein
MYPRPKGRALWEANGPALGRVFGDLSRGEDVRWAVDGNRGLREPSRRRLDEQVEAMAGFVGGFASSSEFAEVRLCLTFASHNFRPSETSGFIIGLLP